MSIEISLWNIDSQVSFCTLMFFNSCVLRFIQHAKYLLVQTNENLCLRIMHALKSMVKSNHEFDTMVTQTEIVRHISMWNSFSGAKFTIKIVTAILLG